MKRFGPSAECASWPPPSRLAHSGQPAALTLNDCLREALGRNPELEAQRYELSAAGDAIWGAQSALFPQLTGDILTQTLNGRESARSTFSASPMPTKGAAATGAA